MVYKDLDLFDLIFIIVTPVGFKPTTAGAEIQCAIQLRHEAFYILNLIIFLQ